MHRICFTFDSCFTNVFLHKREFTKRFASLNIRDVFVVSSVHPLVGEAIYAKLMRWYRCRELIKVGEFFVTRRSM